jgi:3-deoxy-D-manno-octulosonate 8-phosphate phosphatase KdsC-like HAD superfamily phosphatase
MYYSEKGDELKKFNNRDAKAFELLKSAGIKSAIVKYEETNIIYYKI